MPGDTIRPQQPATQPLPAQPAETVVPQVPAEAAAPVAPAAEQPVTPTTQPEVAPAFDPTIYDDNFQPATQQQNDDVVQWTASEFIAHQKAGSWYALLILGAIVAAVLVWFVTKDVVSAIVIVFAAVLFATYAGHQPRQLSYQVDPSGLTIDQKYYDYNQFRSFSVVPEGAFSSIVFTPLKRFGTLTTIYYDPQDEQAIIGVISSRLPHEERRPDAIDNLMHRVRF